MKKKNLSYFFFPLPASQSGNVGIVYYIQKSEDFDWILNDGPHAPYIVVMDTKDFIG